MRKTHVTRSFFEASGPQGNFFEKTRFQIRSMGVCVLNFRPVQYFVWPGGVVQINKQSNTYTLHMEELSRRIFLLIHEGTAKSEAIYPETKIFGGKKSIFENSSRGRPKNQNGRPFSAFTLFFSIILKIMHLSKKNGRTFFQELGYNLHSL